MNVEVMQSRIDLLEKNSVYVFGEKAVKYVDASLAEVVDGRATGTATVSLNGSVEASKLLKFMEYYPVIHITPSWNAKGLILTLDIDKLNDMGE